jgi:ABC-type proline/glycine betaine transport system substrate-binding protein
MEQRKSYKDAKGEAQTGQTLVRPKTDALHDDGLSRSSKETPVMGVYFTPKVYRLPNKWYGNLIRKYGVTKGQWE